MNILRGITIGLVAVFFMASAVMAGDVLSMRQADQILGPSVVKPPTIYPDVEPGKTKVWARAYEGAPAQITHTIEGMVITSKVRKHGCLKCHDKANAKQEEAPSAPPSHYRDFKGEEIKTIHMARLNCTQCHVPQSDAKLRVGSNFKGTKFKGTLK